MSGFKPTGYGPSAGFQFPASYGFTGSTGAYTNVQPHVRHKPRAFKDGGYVSEKAGDPGHALVQRDRPYTNEDQQSGGRWPLRRGFKRGGKMRKADGGAVEDLRRKTKMLAADRDFYRASGKQKKAASFQQMLNEQKGRPALDESWRHKSHGRSPGPTSGPLSAMTKGKFAAADGGRVVYGSSSKGFGSDVRKTGEFIGQIPRMLTEAARGAMRSAQQDVADTKRRRIDRIADGTASNYACGGKVAKRQMGGPAMGYAPMASRMVSAMPQMPTRAAMPMRANMPMRRTMMRSKGGMSRYEKGGAVSDEAQDRKMIGTALRKHVASPAPKGHKGLGAMCK